MVEILSYVSILFITIPWFVVVEILSYISILFITIPWIVVVYVNR